LKQQKTVTNRSDVGPMNAALTEFSARPDTARMRKVWTPPWRWVFGVATVLSLFSFVQAYRLTLINTKPGMTIEAGKLFILNLALWYVPALLIPAIVWAARRFPLEHGRRARAIAVHSAGAIIFALVHWLGLIGVRILLWTDGAKHPAVAWWTYMQRRLLENLDWSLMVYAAIVGVSHAIAYYHESQERKLKAAQLETRLIEARLKTLEAELHPHFLFNTLHAISTLVHRDPEAADRMISRLSDLLRITFDRTGEPKVSLKEEIDFLQKYLDIEQTRFQDRLTVNVTIDPDALDGEVPRMILQPLVENAIKHGIAGRTGGDNVQITAGLSRASDRESRGLSRASDAESRGLSRASDGESRGLSRASDGESRGREGDRLWMQVRDNGAGLQVRTLKALRTGVGLSNTRARLDCLYGRHYRLEFTDKHGGLSVLIEIPFQRVSAPGTPAAFRVA
jgi:two-component system LytT family sensor kinase